MFGTKSLYHNWWFVKLGHFPCGSIGTVALWPPMIISCGFCRGGLRCHRHVTSQHHLWSTVIWCQLLKGKTSNGFAERVGLSFVFQFWICRCFCSLPCFLMRKLLGRQFHGKCKKVIGKTQVAEQGEDVIWLAQPAEAAAAGEAGEAKADIIGTSSSIHRPSRAFTHLPSTAMEQWTLNSRHFVLNHSTSFWSELSSIALT